MLVVRPRKLVGVALGCLCLVAAACSGGAEGSDTVTVFAASSLAEAFEQLETEFEAENPGVDVEINLGGSSSLREQIRAGAPADVFASANEQVMDDLRSESLLAGDSAVFAINSLTIALAPGNPGSLTSPQDLSNDDLLIGVCAAAVPCGELAQRSLDSLGIRISADTNEPDVRALMTKVELGELDAGLVYETDVLATSAAVEVIPLGGSDPLSNAYPIAVLAESANAGGAQGFVDFVLSAEAATVLSSLGFGAPE